MFNVGTKFTGVGTSLMRTMRGVGAGYDQVTNKAKRANTVIKAAPTGILTRLAWNTKHAGGQFRSLAGSVQTAGSALGTFGTLLAGGALLRSFGAYSEGADQIAKFSRTVGLSAESLQEWRFVADRSGLGAERMDKSFKVLSKRMGELKAGQGSLFTFLKRTNHGLLSQLMAAENTEHGFELLIDTLRNMTDVTQKQALADAAVTKANAGVLNIAENTADAIQRLRVEKRALGIITNEAAAQAEAQEDAETNLTTALTGLRDTIFADVLPAITPMIEGFTAFIKENKELSLNITKAAAGIGLAAGAFGVLKIAVLPAISLLSGIGGAALLAAGAAYAIYDNWSGITGYFKDLWQGVKAAFDDGFLNGVVATIKAFNPASLMADAVNGLSKYLFGIDLFAMGKEWFSGLWSGVRITVLTGITDVLRTINSGLDGLNAFGVFDDQIKAIRETIGDLQGQTILESQTSGRLDANVTFANVPPGAAVQTSASENIALNTRVGKSMAQLAY